MTTRARCLAAARAFANTSLRSTGSVAHAMLAAYSSDPAALIGVGAAVLLLLGVAT
jgi:hypothetical protein